jgi:hypothetical protein
MFKKILLLSALVLGTCIHLNAASSFAQKIALLTAIQLEDLVRLQENLCPEFACEALEKAASCLNPKCIAVILDQCPEEITASKLSSALEAVRNLQLTKYDPPFVETERALLNAINERGFNIINNRLVVIE